MSVIIGKVNDELEMEAKRLYDEVATLEAAIAEAIIKGQKSVASLEDIPASGLVSDEDLAVACVGPCPGVVGWADDF